MTMRHGAAIAAALLFSLAAAAPAVRAQQALPAQDGITVQGTGEVRIKPDIARLTLGVQTEAKDSAAAARENATRTQRVIDAIKGAGVAETDIQTTNYSIFPQYRHDPRPVQGGEPAPPQIVGYQVSNQVQVTVRALPNVGKVIDASVTAGANLASGINFDLADPTNARAEALRKAVADATAKADVIAQAAAPALDIARPRVRMVSIVEGSVNIPRPYMEFAAAKMADAVATPIQAGEQTITATVTARFTVVR